MNGKDSPPQTRSIFSPAGKALSVRGIADPSELGVTLMHEHVLADFRKMWTPDRDTPVTEASLWDEQLTLENLHQARDGKPIAQNFILADVKLAIEELSDFRNWGGNTVVELTPIGLKRDPLALRRISYATGINIIMGTGFYSKVFPPDMDQRSVEDLSEEIIRDITVGINQTGIKAGIIGEVGVEGNPITPNEVKSIKAAARASRATGAPISFGRGGVGRDKLRVLSLVGEEGADLTRTIVGHCDWIAGEVPLLLSLLDLGVYVQFDMLGRVIAPLSWSLGKETNPSPGYATPSLVAETILKLVESGYEEKILLSNDVATNVQLKRYGGTGYSYILEKFIPHLRAGAMTENQIQNLIINNPRRVLTFSQPQ